MLYLHSFVVCGGGGLHNIMKLWFGHFTDVLGGKQVQFKVVLRITAYISNM